MIPRRPLVAVAFAAGLLVAASCGGGDAKSDAPPAAAGGDSAISIKNFKFAPADLTVDAGAPITVTNDDGAPHTLTASDGTFDTRELAGGAEAKLSVDEPGEYPYICEIHQYMRGTLTVR